MATQELSPNGVEPPNKRFKSDSVLNVLAPSVMKGEERLRSDYATAKPFPHGRIADLFVEGFLGVFIHNCWCCVPCTPPLSLIQCSFSSCSVAEQVLEEVKGNSKVKFKESDLFRVYQSVDLVRLEINDTEKVDCGLSR